MLWRFTCGHVGMISPFRNFFTLIGVRCGACSVRLRRLGIEVAS